MKTNANSTATALEATDKDFERMMQMLTGISNRVRGIRKAIAATGQRVVPIQNPGF
jgi:hypothetical protein